MHGIIRSSRLVQLLAAIVAAVPLAISCQAATVVWNGAAINFTKNAFADVNLAANQDRITSQVWLTRSNTQGLFNMVAESGFTHVQSPLGTEWAFGTTANYATLTYTNWEAWTDLVIGGPPGTVGKDAVVHLLDGADDIYLDLKFTSWSAGSGGGGAFSYVRSTAPVPESGSVALIGMSTIFLASRRRRDQ